MSELTPIQQRPDGSPLIEIHVTTPDADSAHSIAREIINQRLAACVQCLGPMTSVYTWKDEPHQATEWLLLIKTTSDMFQQISDLVHDRHRYDVPEILAVPVSHALGAYGAWVRDAVAAPQESLD